MAGRGIVVEAGVEIESWTPIRPDGRTRWHARLWLCRCACGRESRVREIALRRGWSRQCNSCGSREGWANRRRSIAEISVPMGRDPSPEEIRAACRAFRAARPAVGEVE